MSVSPEFYSPRISVYIPSQTTIIKLYGNDQSKERPRQGLSLRRAYNCLAETIIYSYMKPAEWRVVVI